MLENNAIFEKFSFSIIFLFENPIIKREQIKNIIIENDIKEKNPDDDIFFCIFEEIFLSQ